MSITFKRKILSETLGQLSDNFWTTFGQLSEKRSENVRTTFGGQLSDNHSGNQARTTGGTRVLGRRTAYRVQPHMVLYLNSKNPKPKPGWEKMDFDKLFTLLLNSKINFQNWKPEKTKVIEIGKTYPGAKTVWNRTEPVVPEIAVRSDGRSLG